MMKAASVALALSFATLVLAQGALTGKWQGETRNGSEIVLELTATDATLTGTLTRNGEASPISDGKVSKNTFTFKATLGGQTESVTGEVSGDQMKVWLDRNPQSTALLTRIK
jgi:hypothetical protein